MNDKTDYAWAAGMLEGEGYAYIVTKHVPSDHDHVRPKPMIRIFNTEKVLLDDLKRVFGGTVSTHQKRGQYKGRNRTKDLFAWVCSYIKAENAAKKMLPYMRGSKREQLKMIIEFYKKVGHRYHEN